MYGIELQHSPEQSSTSQLSFIRTQLQLLASACLLLASKLHDPRPMSLLNLVVFTDCSISVPELQSMEMLVLEKLRYIQVEL